MTVNGKDKDAIRLHDAAHFLEPYQSSAFGKMCKDRKRVRTIEHGIIERQRWVLALDSVDGN